MTCIKELFPRPNISLNERAMRPFIYGFRCHVYEKDEFIDCTIFLDPDTFSMFNIVRLKDGSLYRRINFFEVKNVS
jgi:hypothetical protein